ncbi:MAG: regulatory protein RecX [Bacteroidales bacterium]
MRKNRRPITIHEALNKAMKVCSKEEKCTFDIRQKLGQWQLPQQNHDQIIDQLIDEKFISDERYVRYFVRDKFKFNKWGKVKISYMLKQKQLPDSLIRQALNEEIPEDLYNQTLKKLVEAKNAQIKESDTQKLKAKLVRFASSRGFESGKVFDVVNKIVS